MDIFETGVTITLSSHLLLRRIPTSGTC